jgi:hypothetical protein
MMLGVSLLAMVIYILVTTALPDYEILFRTGLTVDSAVYVSQAEVTEALFERWGSDVDEDGEPWSERTKQDMAEEIAAKRAA